LSFSTGLAVNREVPVEGEGQTNLEGVGMANFDYYKYSDPGRTLTTRLWVYPRLSGWGRGR
jgi:hypothetical protein